MAMRLPGGISNEEAFWDVLVNGKDTRGPIPPDRYNTQGFTDKRGKLGAIKSQSGYFLDQDLTKLDTSFFTLSKTELERADPQQRQLLEVTREVFESAGEVGYRGKSIGCYVGTFGEDWLHMSSKETQHSGNYIITGHCDLMLANRLSYEYDLKGPSIVIKTGCSASLIALHEACRALNFGDCSGAIVAGSNLIMGPAMTAGMSQEGVLSPEGSCKTFDAAADGYARGEAVTAVYLKPLDDAIRDRNPIRAIIRNTASNSDGRSQGLMTPNGESHAALMRKIYADTGLDPALTGFVECHGTGTATGDPIETNAVGDIFGPAGVYIGSVKPNVGHSEGASGITSLIKATLALEHETIPPNIKFHTPNPRIPFVEKNLIVPVKATSWPKSRAKRISINSFGIGGSNAHVILEAYSESHAPPPRSQKGNHRHSEVALISANTQDSAKTLASNIQKYATEHPLDISSIVYTLALHREHLPYRSFLILDCASSNEIPAVTKAPSSPLNVAMVFSGQGAQWPEMGREIIQNDAQFAQDIHEMDDILQSIEYPPAWTIFTELQRPATMSQVHKAEFAQPLCTAIQIAIVNRLRRVGIVPTAVVGHSSGEIAAAYATGALSVTEAILSAYYRGHVTTQQRLVGGMAAVGLGCAEASQYLVDGVVIACDNSPNSVTLSGDEEILCAVLQTIQSDKPDVLARQLKVDIAYHSHHMKALGQVYFRLLVRELSRQHATRQHTSIPLFSSVTGKVIQDGEQLGPAYWESNLTSRVQFNTAVQALLKEQPRTLLLEIGPHSALAGPLRQICSAKGVDYKYVPTMRRGENCEKSALAAIGQLYQNGVSIDYGRLYSVGEVLTTLPTYPWQHDESFWYESRVSKAWRMRNVGHHSLLGLRVPESSSHDPIWRNILSLEDQPWIADHKVVDDVVFPFAGYIAMAGEAVRQATGVDGGFRIRHAIARAAMVLTDGKSVEVLSSLRKLKISDSGESSWFEFTICSISGNTWIKHCEGQVKACVEEQPPSYCPQKSELQRQINPIRWYQAISDIGITYGPEFQGLSGISCSTANNIAAATVSNPHCESPEYLLHPGSIDACLQLLVIALCKGIGRKFGGLKVPTVIEDLVIFPSSREMEAIAWSHGDGGMSVDCNADGKLALRLRGLKFTPMDNSRQQSSNDVHAASRLEWCPDFDFVDHNTLFTPPRSNQEETRMQEEMTLLCILESVEIVKGLTPCQPHFAKFQEWLGMEAQRAVNGTYPILERSATDLVRMSSAERIQMIEELYQQLLSIPDKRYGVIGIKRIFDHCASVFTGERDTLDILMQDDVLAHIYDSIGFGQTELFHLLCHSRPTLRILEVGAGTGGTTEMILRELVRPGDNQYSNYEMYTFTDISAGFFPQAKERFAYAPNIDYQVFDITISPFDQGFKPNSYDVILASNVIHATPSLKATLGNLQPLLRPGGHLVMTELCGVARMPNYLFGNFSGWWLGEADGRPYEPYISVDRWNDELKQAGMNGVETAVRDAEEPYHSCAVIVSQKPLAKKTSIKNRNLTILCENPAQGIAQTFIHDLQAAGITVSICHLGELPVQDQDIISLLDLEGYFFETITPERLGNFQNILSRLNTQFPIIWLLRPTQVKCNDPRSAHAIGVARSIRAESSIQFYTVEIDVNETHFSSLVQRIWEKIINTEDNEILSPEKEYIVDDGVVKVGRYHPFSLEEELGQQNRVINEAGALEDVYSLYISTLGSIDSLQWMSERNRLFISDEDVVIDVRAIGLNFKDILHAMGVLKAPQNTSLLGLEVSGIVRQVGRNVHNVSIGERVVAMSPSACAKSLVTVPSALVVSIPDHLGFVDAAAMPICFSTAIESLINIGRLEEGQSALIHSATGGVGHAAIQICQMIGAEIYATVGNVKKARYLTETFGIPQSRIFNSRNDSFVTGLMHETQGRGVDIVLNSLSGELLHASWDCVAEFGKLIEIGKKDGADFGKLPMHNFLLNRSYCCVDIAHLTQQRYKYSGRLLKQIMQLYSSGEIRALSPITTFDASQVKDAFRHVQNVDHIGKAVIEVPEDFSHVSSTPRPQPLQLDSEASYLLTGGLGGLGRVMSTWLVERGARSLVFLSRSAGSSEKQQFLRELTSCGCSVTIIPGRAESKEDIEVAVTKAPRPIKGVIHLAMVLQDSPFASMSSSDWAATNAPKVNGAWNMHEIFPDRDSLDFLVLASSIVTVVEQPGQGNYSAANTYLEAFCQYRRSRSLPASVLNICPIDGVGNVAENNSARKSLKAQGLYFLGEKELLDFLELSIFISKPSHPTPGEEPARKGWRNPGQIVMGLRAKGDLNDPNTRTNWRRDRRMGFYHNINQKPEGYERGGSSELSKFLSGVADDPAVLARPQSAEFLATEIGKKICSFMLKSDDDLDINLTLAQMGLDSLMAIELRRWWKMAFGLQISVLELMATGTVMALGALAASQLKNKFIEV
ncbi:hypothetical protein ASPWEDRAFT_48144 [Aspergillus wentii DTO 134E9]|uniref:Uncharacterized protein n=1 Tax=Aspergillus wentii DTO 134E9 TaxID=1073089 RepID=A0A1L9S364_ASPWE|nr:uncharacterized protein ASPWEDRAFT_48144 [Aspergillus wentii DTO 134E9]OJJ41603.1 hypothetical protein ASPWEDRAFT_48144 [Aspergillus wentii DTO 134E9]